MSQHTDNDPAELECGLRIDNLPINHPSMLADSYRNGWHFAKAGYTQKEMLSMVAEVEALNLSQKGK